MFSKAVPLGDFTAVFLFKVLITFIYVCMCALAHTPWHVCGSQGTTCGSQSLNVGPGNHAGQAWQQAPRATEPSCQTQAICQKDLKMYLRFNRLCGTFVPHNHSNSTM